MVLPMVLPLQALARQYPGVVFLRLVGNTSPEAKELFKAKLKCRSTPTFYFFRKGGWWASARGYVRIM